MLRLSCFAIVLSFGTTVCQAESKEGVTEGQPAPAFTVTGIDGKEFSLADKLKGGEKNIALMFSRANW